MIHNVGAASGMFAADNDDPREPYRQALESRFNRAEQAAAIAQNNYEENDPFGYSQIASLLPGLSSDLSDRELADAALAEWDTVKRLHHLLITDFDQFLLEWEG